MTIVRYPVWSPWHEMQKWVDDFSKEDQNFPCGAQGWSPKVDIMEEKDRFTIHVDLPGMDKKDVSILVENNICTIRGKREYAEEKKVGKQLRMERCSGEFSRSFSLPTPIDESKVKAKMQHGVLEISIPKMGKETGKMIQIEG